MPGLIAKKVGMTSVYGANGNNIPCTILEVGPCVVTQVKTVDKDGYDAIQLGYGERKESRLSKPLKGHFEKAGVSPKQKMVEFKGFDQELNIGDTLKVEDVFAEGQYVSVIGTSKGKGFQGVVKRHKFAGVGQATHGQHNRLRAPGSIGAASDPSRVFKGMRMGGQMGNERVTVENLEIVKIIAEEGLIVLKGSVPGFKTSTVLIRR